MPDFFVEPVEALRRTSRPTGVSFVIDQKGPDQIMADAGRIAGSVM